ncbi:hypothetical protein [Aeromicrobium sp. UC242_57]|uniref:hypothetical protein n=1 Tax=Aeromicrobium sp. UC242_57 TaxID=3374624 RepID=UPI0037A5CB86
MPDQAPGGAPRALTVIGWDEESLCVHPDDPSLCELAYLVSRSLTPDEDARARALGIFVQDRWFVVKDVDVSDVTSKIDELDSLLRRAASPAATQP